MGSQVEHNARQIERYLTTHAALVGPNGRPDEPMGKKARGGSRSPASEKLIRFMDANTVASLYVSPEIEAVWNSAARYGEIYFADLLTELYRNPAIIRTWKAGATLEDAQEYTAFQKMCRFIADLIRGYEPNLQLHVTVALRDEPLQKEGAPHHRHRRITAEDSKRRRYERLLEIEQAQGCSRTAAVGMLADRLGIGESTIWESVQFCEKESA